MFGGHDPYLVALSMVIAILGGFTGFGLAARIRGTPGVSRRVLLAGAAAFLAISRAKIAEVKGRLGLARRHAKGGLASTLCPGNAGIRSPNLTHFVRVFQHFVRNSWPRVMATAAVLPAKNSGNSFPPQRPHEARHTRRQNADSREDKHDSRLIQLSPACDRGRCSQTALDPG
jgi:hypothetical protein